MKPKFRENIIITIESMQSIISMFLSPFLLVYFITVSLHGLADLSLFRIASYLVLPISCIVFAGFMKKHALFSYRFGMILNAVILLCIIMLQDDLVNWVYPIGIVSGAMLTFFWMPQSLFTISEIDNKRRVIVEAKKQTASAVIKIGAPILLGLFITETNYTITACIILVCCLVQIIASFALRPSDTVLKQESGQFRLNSFSRFWREKPLKLIWQYAFLRGWAIDGAAGEAIMVLLVYQIVQSDTGLGVSQAVLSAILMIIAWLYNRHAERLGVARTISYSGALAILSAGIMLVWPSATSIFTGFIVINTVIASIHRIFYLSKRYEITSIHHVTRNEIMNMNIWVEVFLNVGRTLSWIGLFIVAGYDSISMLIWYLFALVVINIGLGGVVLLRLNKEYIQT